MLKIKRTGSVIGMLAASTLFQFVYVLKEGLCDLLGQKIIVKTSKQRKKDIESPFPYHAAGEDG